jgi:hypothetical protein
MLQVKSFSVQDGEKISKFLEENTLAKDATILITNGYLAIPYEDGRDLTLQQRMTRAKEQINFQQGLLLVANHDQRKLEVRIFGIKQEIEKVEERISRKTGDKKRDYDLEKEGQKEIKVFENMIANHEASLKQGQAHITDIMIDLSVYKEELHTLEVELGNQK